MGRVIMNSVCVHTMGHVQKRELSEQLSHPLVMSS